MRMKGQKLGSPNEEIIPIPRGTGDDIIFIARAIQDMTPFEKLCPPPKPPMRKIGADDIPNLKDPNYLKQVNAFAEKKMSWMYLTSLEATEGLEWDKVDVTDPSTWHLFRSEMHEAGFSDIEIDRVMAGVVSVNALSDVKIDAARERFLLLRQERLDALSSQKED